MLILYEALREKRGENRYRYVRGKLFRLGQQKDREENMKVWRLNDRISSDKKYGFELGWEVNKKSRH